MCIIEMQCVNKITSLRSYDGLAPIIVEQVCKAETSIEKLCREQTCNE
jgi:hypothetical protein